MIIFYSPVVNFLKKSNENIKESIQAMSSPYNMGPIELKKYLEDEISESKVQINTYMRSNDIIYERINGNMDKSRSLLKTFVNEQKSKLEMLMKEFQDTSISQTNPQIQQISSVLTEIAINQQVNKIPLI